MISIQLGQKSVLLITVVSYKMYSFCEQYTAHYLFPWYHYSIQSLFWLFSNVKHALWALKSIPCYFFSSSICRCAKVEFYCTFRLSARYSTPTHWPFLGMPNSHFFVWVSKSLAAISAPITSKRKPTLFSGNLYMFSSRVQHNTSQARPFFLPQYFINAKSIQCHVN
jgi:hypothetical protein